MQRRRATRGWRFHRAGKGMPEPLSVVARAQTFAAASRDFACTTLLATGTTAGVTGHLITPDRPEADRAALDLAHAVSARAEPVDELPDLSGTRFVGVARADVRQPAGRASQAGADPAESARRIAQALRPDRSADAADPPNWLAVTVRRPTRRELVRTRVWYAARLGATAPVHHVMDTNAVAVTVFSGGASAAQVRQRLRQVTAALPGFDVAVRVRILRTWPAAVGWPVLALAAAATLHTLGRPPLVPLLVVFAGLLLALLGLRGALPSRSARTVRRCRGGVFHPPRHKVGPTRAPSTGGEPGRRRPGGGDYPLARDVFLVGPALLVGVVAPHAGAASGSAVTDRRAAPAAMLDPAIGPSVGTAGAQEAACHLSAADMPTGVLAVGRPGSGKSVLIRTLFGWHCLDRVRPTGAPGFPGRSNTLIAFESKGDGAAVYRGWSDAVGDSTGLIEVADPDSLAVDIFDLPGTIGQRARTFANMLVYCFDDGAIQGQSFESLEATLTGGLAVTPAIARQAGQPPDRSPIHHAHVLLGGRGDAAGRALAAALSEAAGRATRSPTTATDAADLIAADDQLIKLYGPGISEAARTNQLRAARNKVGDLLAAESWWSPRRRKVTWRQILTNHWSVVVNTGATAAGHRVDDRITAYLTSLLTYSLVETIKLCCAGWQERGRSVSVFSDEVALMAGSSSQTLTWLHDQGRAYGVRPFLSTQRLQQLPADLRASLLDYSTICWFAQSSPDAAEQAVADLSADGSEWSVADITGLEPYTAVVRSYVHQIRQPPVPVRLTNFEDRMDEFPAAQHRPLAVTT